MPDVGQTLHPDAYALRPVRVVLKQNTFRYYGATTFPNDPRQGCELYICRCRACGFLKDDGTELTLDVLNDAGDIVQEFPLTRDGLRYLRAQFRFKVEQQ